MFIGAIQSSNFFRGGSVTPSFLSNIVVNQNVDEISVSFDVDVDEVNAPPSIDFVTITGTLINGETLTCNIDNFYSPSSYQEGTHLYQWYRSDSKQSLGSAIVGATNPTYVLTGSDVSKHIRCVVTTVQVGGQNDQGSPVTSIYTDSIADIGFNPFTDITWFTAHSPDGYTTGTWINQGTGNDSTQNASDNVPTATVDGPDFESSNNQELVIDQPTPQFSMPVEVWIRVKFESFNAAWAYMVDWNGAQRLEQRTSGAIYLSNGTCAYTPVIGNWVVMRFVISGASNTSKFTANNGTPKTNVAAVTTAFGTSNGRIGSNSSGTANRFDGIISHLFVRSGELSSGEVSDMWTWFSDNFPWT